MTTTTTARCTWAGHDEPDGCGWTAAGPGTDHEAARHTRTTGHVTQTRTTPIEPSGVVGPIERSTT